MRLGTISEDLAGRVSTSSNPETIFEVVFWQCARQLSAADFELLDNPALEQQLKENVLPKEGRFFSLRDELDEKYFDAEDQGQLELSGRYFALARLVSALDFYQEPRSTDDLGDDPITSRSEFDRLFPESSFPPTSHHTSSELQQSAWEVYQATSQGTKPIVMGRLADTEAGEDLGFQCLDTDVWSLEVNDAWVQGGIDARRNFYLGSPETADNLWDAVNNRPTVMAREIQQLRKAGYVRQGDYYVHPSRISGN